MSKSLLLLVTVTLLLVACTGRGEPQEETEARFKITVINGEIAGFELADQPDVFGPDVTWDEVFLYSPRAILEVRQERIPDDGADYTIEVFYVSEYRSEDLMAIADELDLSALSNEATALDE